MSSSPPSIPLGAIATMNLDPTMGALFIGILLAAIFHGITTLQTIFYYTTYPKDRGLFKFLVAFVWALDTLSLAMVSFAVYMYVIKDFGNPLALMYINWGVAAEPAVSGTIALIVHLFLSSRIWKLDRRLASFAIILSVIAFVPFGISFASVGTILHKGSHSLWTDDRDLRWMSITADVVTVALDLGISATICVLLYKSRTGFGKTDKIITFLTIYTINSGLLPTMVSMGGMIAYLVSPSTLIFEAFIVTISKAYSNTFLATLNSRQSIMGRAMDDSSLAATSGKQQLHLPLRIPPLSSVKESDFVDTDSEVVSLTKLGHGDRSRGSKGGIEVHTMVEQMVEP
ncbi:hypothetical protein SCP_0201180 [Sparassis crispa]|uniref:DUF6534 domain-containing protein n=1 Tax=Sparassis crispa TaxID=139825 RepID=A0A401G9U0_9APHY|nr:hypothetical protein SCP_0201180 [Sparassis crispa]GBE78921.1 hypothetical protein SCP_0201180 [Sparassis crispa]